MVYPRDSFIDHPVDAALAQHLIGLFEHLHDIGNGGLVVNEQSSIGQPLMRPCRLSIQIERQESLDTSLVAEDDGMVGKAVGMVIHVSAVEEEGRIAGMCHKAVPLVVHGWGIDFCFNHWG